MKKIVSALLAGLVIFAGVGCGSEEAKSKSEPTGGQVVLANKYYTLFLEGDDKSAALDFNVYDDGVLCKNPKVSYEVANKSVAEMNGNKIEAKGIGKTEVSVKYKQGVATAEVSVVGKVTEEQVNTFDEKYVNIYGRTYLKDGKLCLDNPAIVVEAAVNGGTVTAQIEVDTTMYIWAEIDGKKAERICLTPERTEYTIASNLDSGFHVVGIANSSEGKYGQIRLCSISADEFYNAPEKPEFFVEFIGDSLTAGYGSLGEKGQAETVHNSDSCSTFGYLTPRELGVDYSVIARSGICVTKDVWGVGYNMETLYTQNSIHNSATYEFKRSADVVVINLGTNDHSYMRYHPEYTKEEFVVDYVRFLQLVREKNPKAHIICLYGFASKDSRVDQGIAMAVEELNDAKICYLNDRFHMDGNGVNGHPTASSQRIWGKTLAKYIRNLMN